MRNQSASPAIEHGKPRAFSATRKLLCPADGIFKRPAKRKATTSPSAGKKVATSIHRIEPSKRVAIIGSSLGGVAAFGRLFTPLLLKQLHARLGVSPAQLRPIDHIANVYCPILIISGEKDNNTKPTDTRMLFDRARTPKQLWLVPNAGHVDLHHAEPHEYEARVLAFFAQAAESS
jgi:fermentation-respiration switch protein FrsA (DUF1100 family)